MTWQEAAEPEAEAERTSHRPESERHAAAERLGELIERREELLIEVSQVEAEMKAAEATVRSFE
jgi:hypothetical protein